MTYQGKIAFTVRGSGFEGKWLCGHYHATEGAAYACAAAEARRTFVPPRERGRAYPDRYASVTVTTAAMP